MMHTNIQYMYDETFILPIHKHLQLHASQYKQKRQHPSHPLHKHTTYFTTSFKNPLSLTTNIPRHSHYNRHKTMPLCNNHTHTTHIISSTAPTLSPLDLWTDPAGVSALLLARLTEKLAGGPQAGR